VERKASTSDHKPNSAGEGLWLGLEYHITEYQTSDHCVSERGT
jgi:hypothetical protein